MPNKSPWKAKYAREWKAFEKRRQLARSRGYILPSDIALITQARGGYRQAYERIHRYTQVQIQRESSYKVPQEDGVGVQYVRGSRIMSQQREYRRKYGHTTQDFYGMMQRYTEYAMLEASYRAKQLEREREAQIEREREVQRERERTVQQKWQYEPAEDYDEYDDFSDSVEISEEIMPQENVRKSIIEEVEYYIETIQNKSLKYKLKKLYANNIVHNYWDAMNNMKDESSKVISLLQEAASLPYYTKGVSQQFLDDLKEKEQRIAGEFERLLTGTYTDASSMDNAERS